MAAPEDKSGCTSHVAQLRNEAQTGWNREACEVWSDPHGYEEMGGNIVRGNEEGHVNPPAVWSGRISQSSQI